MQNWAKRGLQTALVTGGLLMLGTGIASADERVDPDAAPSPLDGGVSVPIKIGNWNIGTPFGEKHVDTIVDKEITTGDSLAEGSAQGAQYAKGNVIAPNALVPVEATGWAVAAGGNAHNVNESTESHSQGGPIETTGEGDGFAGNVIAPTAVVPAQVTGIAFPLLGTATVDNTTNQDSTAGGSVTTDGDGGAGSGNIVAPQVALPAAVNNTAAGWFAGVATVHGDSTQTASAPGNRETSGDESVLSGNIATAPAAGPAQVDGTAGSWGGKATNHSTNTAAASAGTAGSERETSTEHATTSGDNSLAGGNAAVPELAPLATVDCTAGAWGGISTSECTDSATTEAGGPISSSGDDSVLGGNLAGAPASAPATVDCTAGAWGGIVSSTCDETTSAEAGNAPEMEDFVTTDGDMSAIGGNIITAQPAPLAAVDCTAGVWGGDTATECVNDSTSAAGGGTETSGDESQLGGNIVDADAAVPAEGYSNAGAWGGFAEAAGTKTVLADAGGMADTSGEDSVGGGNTARPKLASPVAVDCNAPIWGGESVATCTTESEAESGGDTHSNGEESILGGNNAEAPVSPVVSGSGNAPAWIGDSTSTLDNTTSSEAGGYTFTQGDESIGGGNQALTPAAGAGDVTCVSGAWVGETECIVDNDVDTTAGGYNGTTGDDSTGAGNVVTTPQAPVAEVFGIAGDWGGTSTANYTEDKDVTAGGDSQTNDDNGTVSSNIATVPWAPAAQVSNIAAAWVGTPTSIVDADTKNTAGGDATASANQSTLSGNIAEAPLALPADAHTVAATWVGNALAEGTHNTESTAGGDATTTAQNAQLSGNIAGAQGAGAANTYGWAASWVGNNLAHSDKTLSSTAGGDSTTDGTMGNGSGNQVLANGNAVAGVFGNAASFVAHDTQETTSVTDVTSGGDAVANGDLGNLAGNVVQADAQPLAQVFGINAAAVGSTLNHVDTTTDATNGGTVEASGMGGNLAGDIVDADAQAPWQVFGIEAAALGSPVNTVLHETATTNSGTNATNGDGGNLAGNVVNGDAQWPAQVFGLDAAALGTGVNTVSDSLTASNGGNTDASGVDGNGSGNIIAAQAQAVPQVIGWGVGALGTATQGTTSDTTAVNGGDNTTAGDAGSLSGNILDVLGTLNPGTFAWAGSVFGNVVNGTDNSTQADNGGTATSTGGQAFQLPIGFAPQINEVVIPIGGQITNVLTNENSQSIAGASVLGVDSADGLMPASGLPSLPSGFGRSGVPTPDVPGLDGLSAVQDAVSGVLGGGLPAAPEMPAAPGLPATPGLPAVPAMPAAPEVGGLPQLPAAPVGRSHHAGLPELPGVPQLPEMDATQLLIPQITMGDSTLGDSSLDGLPTGRSDVPGPEVPLVSGSLAGLPMAPAMPAMPETPDLPVLAQTEIADIPVSERSLPAPGLPTPAVPGVQQGVDAFQSNLRPPAQTDVMPQLDTGEATLPEVGSVSGQLPMGDLGNTSSLGQTPAMPGLDSANLQGLLGGMPVG